MSEALACRHYISDRIDSGYLLCSISRLMNDDTQRIRIETSLEQSELEDQVEELICKRKFDLLLEVKTSGNADPGFLGPFGS